MGKFVKGHKGYWLGKSKPHSEETKQKISEGLKGHKVSRSTRKKLAAAGKGRVAWNKGVTWSPEARAKISKTCREKGIEPKVKYVGRGEKASNWKGGKVAEYRVARKWKEYKQWREAVFARDNWTCQKTGVRGIELHPHHILNFSQYRELRFDVNNGITLSVDAHAEFHNKYGRTNNTREQLMEFLAA